MLGIFVQNMFLEWFGMLLDIVVFTDSAAGKVISIRRGVGRVRHLEVKQLVIQQITNSERVKIMKCKGQSNIADVGTNPYAPKEMPKSGAC